jgi:hypothetical protein
MTLVFPSSPAVGDYYAPGSRVWRWTGTIWQIVQPVQFAKVGNYVETITPTPIGHQRLLNGAAPLVALLLGLSSLFAWGQAPTVSKVMVDVKMSDNTFEEQQLTPVADNVIGFDGAGALVVKAGGGGISGTLGTTNNALPRASGTGGSTLQGSAVTIADDGTLTKAETYELGKNGSNYGRIGLWDADNTGWIYFSAGPSKFLFPDIVADSFSGSGSSITSLNAANISSGTLGVARGGTGLTSAGTAGNVLTSNGTIWTSAAPSTTNPAGSGSELQFRSSGTAFGAVTNSSVSSGAITLGAAEALGTTSTARLTVANTTAAAAGAQQVSPSIVLEGQGWKTTATAASQIVRFRQNVLPVQGAANPTGNLVIESEVNNTGTWTQNATLSSAGAWRLGGATGPLFTPNFAGAGRLLVNNDFFIGEGGSGGTTVKFLAFSTNPGGTGGDIYLQRDAANTLGLRNTTAAQTFRVYETDSGANDEYLEFSAASGTNVIRPQATGTGTASVVRYHTTTAVFWTSGSGSPESVVTAPVGSMYTDTAGGAATTLYVKESGTGSTGWIAK